MEIRFFDKDLEVFISNLEENTIAKLLRTIDLLEQFGYKLALPHSKKISNRLFELRIRGKIEVRIFYTFYAGGIVLLYGFIKKTQKSPKKYLLQAKKRISKLKFDIL